MAGCKSEQKQLEFGSQQIAGVFTNMTDIMVHDITNPPLAARFFAYASLAGYEITQQHNDNFYFFF